MTTRCASSRSVRTLASASSSGARPFSGTSALAVVISRPGTRATAGRGPNTSGSTPTGTMCRRSAGDAHLRDDVAAGGLGHRERSAGSGARPPSASRGTPYQRRRLIRRQGLLACARSRSRSTVIGWCSVAQHGPAVVGSSRGGRCRGTGCRGRGRSRRAGPRRSRRARMLNAHGSGKPAAHMMANSPRSIASAELLGPRDPERVRRRGRGRGPGPRGAARDRTSSG